MSCRIAIGLAQLLTLALPLAAGAQSLRVRTATGRLRLDGRLDEPDWMRADSLTDFRQREPRMGEPATERTVVRVLRDAGALYVGIRAYDGAPRRIRATQLRRDASLSSDDNVQFIIDSFHDRRGAFVFGTNPNGARWDAQLADLDNLNENWNGIWDVAVSRDATGWAAEFRIPFRTLRFRNATDVRFGFNVRRFIRRKNEQDLWRSWGRTEGLYQLLRAGELSDIGDVGRARDVELYPYVLSRAIEPAHDSVGARAADGFVGAKAGLDAKLAVSPTLTADVTAGTDFAQVEADQQVINLTRFPFFFPEKRQFFLESSGQFDFGTAERAQVFYSRRIGLDSTGSAVPIVAGGRLYGRAGPWRIGVLDAQTGGERANNAVVRMQHDLLARSYVGIIGTLRTAAGSGPAATAGFDMDFPLIVHGQNLEPKFWIAGSRTPGVSGVPLAWRLSADNPNDLFDNFISLYRIDAGFDPALGFVRRTGIWETTGHVDFMPRPHALGIRQLDFTVPIPSWDIIADASGSLGRTGDWQTAWFEWRVFGGDRDNGDHFEINYQRQFDAPRDTFEMFRGVSVPPGRYWWSRYELQYETSAAHPLSIGAFVNWGPFYGGRSADLELQGTWRGGGHAIVGVNLTRTAARLPARGFTALQTSSRLEYDFNPRTSLLGFVQYTNEDQRVDFNIRFHWIPVIGDDVFIVWNSGYSTNPATRYRFPATSSLTRQLN
ncbi:MAG: hypothetical protein DMD48_10800, partial [Gemmatimonadetes bacterium]